MISPFFLVLLLLFFPSHIENPDFSTCQQNAVNYLIGQFNATVGLCAESEETGEHWLGPWAKYNSTYWLYSDNLYAYHALKVFTPEYAEKIRHTYEQYSFPKDTKLFGVLFGENLSGIIGSPVNVALVNQTDRVVIYRRHEGALMKDWSLYADTIIYRALDEYQFHNQTTAKKIFQNAVKMWDGKGLYDDASTQDGFYANYKLALLLYAARFMRVKLSIEREVERKLWSAQNALGGIRSLTDSNGTPFGSANVETTALVLLPYTLGR